MWALVGRETGCDGQCDSLLHSNRDFSQIIRSLFSTETAPCKSTKSTSVLHVTVSDDTGTSSLTSELYFWRLERFNARSTCTQNTWMSFGSNSVSLFCKTLCPLFFHLWTVRMQCICVMFVCLCMCLCAYYCVCMFRCVFNLFVCVCVFEFLYEF